MTDSHAVSLVALLAQDGVSGSSSGGGGNAALITFGVYTAVIFMLAFFSHRLLRRMRSFLGEYYLGSRSLTLWVFAFTFAATAASVGSFGGFPARIYTSGWVLALWIASYMVFPLTTMGLLGKRLGQVARKTGAITLPDLMRGRMNSRAVSILISVLMLFFLGFYLIPQFKLASIMLNTLLGDVPAYGAAVRAIARMTNEVPPLVSVDPGYLLCLFAFAVAVVFYTAFGGFRAVVWTDVLQGFVMVAGVVIMLVLTLTLVGPLPAAAEKLRTMTPPRVGTTHLLLDEPAGEQGRRVREGAWLLSDADPVNYPGGRIFRLNANAVIGPGRSRTDDDSPVTVSEITTPHEILAILSSQTFEQGVRPVGINVKPYAGGAGQPGAYVTGPGPSQSSDAGFLPLGLAVSFFFMWAISGAGQPGNMVRLMAYDHVKTLRRGIAVVTIYFGLIYFPLVVIFCYARLLIPGWDADPDNVMPKLCVHLGDAAGMPWLAGLLVAAPFAAAMSTVDSFMLMISSSLVRDLWQRNVQPDMSRKAIKRMTYAVTAFIGVIIFIGAINPPKFLQDVIVYCGSGLAVCFLIPVAMAMYWPRVNPPGVIAAILGGFATHLSLYMVNWFGGGRFSPYALLGVDPIIWGLAASLLIGITVTLLTPAPPADLVRKFFYREDRAG